MEKIDTVQTRCSFDWRTTRFGEESVSFLGFGRTSQIRTGDLYHVNIDGCTNVHSSMRILTLYASIESLQRRLLTTRLGALMFATVWTGRAGLIMELVSHESPLIGLRSSLYPAVKILRK